MKNYESVNTATGEITSKFSYFTGQPKEYRFDARLGQFNLNGTKPLLDKSGKPVKSFTFQPIAYRFFTAQMFGRERVEKWFEVFFADEKNHVSGVMFNSTNVEPFENLMLTDCLYEGLTLCDLIITATPKEVVSKKDPNKKWFVCELSSELADTEKVIALQEFDADFKVFRKDSVKDNFELGLIKSHYFENLVIETQYVEPKQIEATQPV